MLRDAEVRIAAFDWLHQQADRLGDVLPHALLLEGFTYRGERVPLLGPQGIFKPRVLPRIPLSITTTLSGPYDDRVNDEGFLSYRYRGTDPTHRDNIGLREGMARQVPLVYFHAVVPGKYLATWPVFVVGDDPKALTFTVAVDDPATAIEAAEAAEGGHSVVAEEVAPRRAYVTATVLQRLHQKAFRERVLEAYSETCALCRLRHRELLEASHIIADKEPGGEPVVPNGIALCALHHAAFDEHFIGVRPDYTVVVRPTILEEEDGPMLRHGLQGLHGSKIIVPRDSALQPDRDRLARRWERFQSVA